jgi:hypothetical protein
MDPHAAALTIDTGRLTALERSMRAVCGNRRATFGAVARANAMIEALDETLHFGLEIPVHELRVATGAVALRSGADRHAVGVVGADLRPLDHGSDALGNTPLTILTLGLAAGDTNAVRAIIAVRAARHTHATIAGIHARPAVVAAIRSG